MSLGSLHIVPHRSHPASSKRLVAFWLGFAALLVLATLALALPSKPRFAIREQQAAPGAPQDQGGGLFGLLRDVVPTSPPADTPDPNATQLPPPPTDIPVDTAVPVDTLVPVPSEEPSNTPEPPPSPIPTSTFGPTDTSIPPTDVPTPVPNTPTSVPDTPVPTIIPEVTETTAPTPLPAPTREDTPIPPGPTSLPTTEITNTPNITPTIAPVDTAAPVPTIFLTAVPNRPVPTVTSLPTEEVLPTEIATLEPTVTRTRAPTVTSTIIPADTVTPTGTTTATAQPTPNLTATAIDLDATATANTFNAQATAKSAIATAGAAVATARSTSSSPDAIATAIAARSTAESALSTVIPGGSIQLVVETSTPERVFEKAVTATLAANSGAPILIYTYTQQINASGENIVAVCLWNLGTVAATDVGVQFDARAPASFTAGRVPSEQSEFDNQQVKVRIANLNPQTLRQIEVGVIHVEAPLPQWVGVSVPSAYALDHPGDPPFPVACTPSDIKSAAPESHDVQLEVGGLYDEVNARIRAEQERTINPGVFSLALKEERPAFSSFVLYCVIGLILAMLLVISLLAGERRKRVKPTRRRQRTPF